MARSMRSATGVLDVLVRLGLAAVWLTSGTIKMLHPADTYLSVQAFDVLPAGTVPTVAAALPFLELALGVLALLGYATRVVAAASALLLLGFMAGITQAWIRGLSIDCGCFGGGGQVAQGDTRYPLELLRDLGFLVLAAWLLVRGRTPLSLDALLSRGHATDPEPPGTMRGIQHDATQ